MSQLRPEYDEAKLADEEFELIIQVNSKIRAKVMVKKGISKEGNGRISTFS